jgi:hypothetical protein
MKELREKQALRADMPSQSLQKWFGERAAAFAEIDNAHVMVGGTQRGRRYATQQINYAYATLLSSQFQGYCRDLHSECIDPIVARAPANLQALLRAQFLWGRTLDKGNPNPGNVGSDFGRFGVEFWRIVRADHQLNQRRQDSLEELNKWRNAISHQDFDPAKLGGTIALHLRTVRAWRRALDRLALSFDSVMASYLQTLLRLRAVPW